MILNNEKNRAQYVTEPQTRVRLYFEKHILPSISLQARNVDWGDPDITGFIVVGNNPPTLPVTAEEDEAWQDAEKRMDVIGQNGGDGEHYKEQIEKASSKYHVAIKGAWVDAYDILKAFNVTNPALAHLIKKALKPGERGHKDLATDMNDIVDSAVRARELEE